MLFMRFEAAQSARDFNFRFIGLSSTNFVWVMKAITKFVYNKNLSWRLMAKQWPTSEAPINDGEV